MQNPSAITTRSRAVAPAAGELSWSFMLLVVVCACVVAVGFFFAARQHFTSMDYGLKNSKLRDQLQNLETEKRRLLLAREVATSPMAIRKAARSVGMRESAEVAAVAISSKVEAPNKVSERTDGTIIRTTHVDSPLTTTATTATVVRTAMSAPVQQKPAPPRSNGETRSRVVDGTRDKKEKNDIAALLKFR